MSGMNLSYSQTAVARSCWMKYKFQYIDGLRPISTKPSLTLGKIIHECFELFYDKKTDQEICQHINNSFDKEISQAGPHDAEALIIAKYTALGMWLYYPKKNNNFQEMKPEMEFSVPVSNVINYVGRVDGLIKMNNKYWIREVKTTGLSMRQFEGRMQTSYQATGYIWAIQKLLGIEVQGVMYDCIKKPLLRKRTEDTADDFGRRIMNDYAEPDKQKHYYTRLFTYRTPDDIKRYTQDMAHLVGDMCKRIDNKLWYRNPDACFQFNTQCPYRPICFCDTPDTLTLDLNYTRSGHEQSTTTI